MWGNEWNWLKKDNISTHKVCETKDYNNDSTSEYKSIKNKTHFRAWGDNLS